MKLRLLVVPALLALPVAAPAPRADEVRRDEVVARSNRAFNADSPFEDNPLLEQLHRALLETTSAEISLAFPLLPGAQLGPGPITAGQVLALAPPRERIVVVELTAAEVRALLERAAAVFERYDYAAGRPLLAPGAAESSFVTAGGMSYELDLTAPAGERAIHLTRGGAPLDSSRALRVATTESVVRRLRLPAPTAVPGTALADALLARIRRAGALEGSFVHHWSLLPDFATAPERELLDRMVRLDVLPRAEGLRFYPDQPASRGDLAYWLSRAYDWREVRFSGAFPDVPDSLEPWLDGLVKRRIIGAVATEEFFQPFAPVGLPLALQWCENAAREARYALDTEPERRSFRRGLMAGTSLLAEGQLVAGGTITRSQALAIVANARYPVVRLLHTSDFHGSMLPRDAGGRRRGGSAALAAHLKRLAAENPEGTLLTDGGDAFQGTMISNLAHGRPVVEQMNQLGYAAMAIGNHDFDWSVDTLARRIGEMRFAALAANLVAAGSGQRPRWARADTLMVRRGVRIGVLGLAFTGTPTATHPRNVERLRFPDDSATAAALVPGLRRRGAEVVVGLGHIPGIVDSAGTVHGRLARLASGVPGVDAWLGGHGHAWVAAQVAGVPVVVPGSHGEAIGVCDLVVDPLRDRVVEHQERLVRTWTDEVAPDSAIQALVERWNQAAGELGATPVGQSLRKLGRQRGGESAIGSLVADAMRESAGTEVALQNNGGLRADLPEGTITRGALYEVLPFENSIVTMTLEGHELRQVLEQGLATERVIQVSGFRYRFDLGRLVGSRVTALLDEDGKPLDERRRYRVAVNDFMAAGGDSLVTLENARDAHDTEIGQRQALEDWVRARVASGRPLDYQGDGRVTREPGSKPPERGEY